MDSLTKTRLDGDKIDALARAAFGTSARLLAVEPIEHGWYNAGYRVDLAGSGPPRTFLKVAPMPSVPVLRYEDSLMHAEAATLDRLAASGITQTPAVEARDFSRRIVPADCLFLEWRDGMMLSEAMPSMTSAERLRVRRQIGAVLGASHRIDAQQFGYAGRQELQAKSWPEAFGKMVDALLADAAEFDASLPAPKEDIAASFTAASHLIESVREPRLTHFDLWDKNILVKQDARGWGLSAILDWERGFYGDPLADVFSATLTSTQEERQALLTAAGLEDRGPEDEINARRAALYRAYLWLVMIVEAPSRGFGGSIRMPGSQAGKRLLSDLALATANPALIKPQA